MFKQLRNQLGNVGNAILLILVMFGLFVAFYDPKATPEELTRLAEMSEVSPEAQKVYKDFLSQNPTPTKDDLRKTKAFIEDEAAIKVSREITGNPDLKSDAVLKKEDDERSAKERAELASRLETIALMEMTNEEKIMWVILNLPRIVPFALVLLIPGICFAFYRKFSGGYTC